MIIDFRLRPPLKPFTSMKVYGEVEGMATELGEHPDPAAVNRDIDLLFQEMADLDIVHAVCSGRVLPQPELSTNNDDISAVIRMYPDKFSGLGAIDPRNAKKAIAEAERCVTNLGLKGISLSLRFFHDPPKYADDRSLYPLYDFCQDRSIPVSLTLSTHAGYDMSYSHPLAVDHVARDFSKLTIIIQHGCWPWVMEICGLCFTRKNVYLSWDFYGVSFPGRMHYVDAANKYLEDRVLFGSGFPMRNLKMMVEGHKALPLRPEVAEKYFYSNGARLLGLA